jgi:hypothetical protein
VRRTSVRSFCKKTNKNFCKEFDFFAK